MSESTLGGVRAARAALVAALAAILALTLALAPAADASNLGPKVKNRKVANMMLVGNNWEGTADVIYPRGKFKHLEQLNIIPDYDERIAEILTDPVRTGYFLGIRELVGEGNDQFVDDMYTSRDGKVLVVSRPSFRDVVGFKMGSGKLIWRFVVDGQRSDHMAVSPDNKTVAVSASTGNVVHILDIKTGEEVLKFDSGDSPHENVYSADGERIYHASIGLVYTPADRPVVDTSKGDRFFQIVDADTGEILERWNMGEKLAEAGFADMSAAVRPMAITADEKTVYLQVSFFHGYVQFDLEKGEVVDVVEMPISDEAASIPREQYLLDSAHHGIALSGDDSQLCIAGTMSDYAALVDLETGDKKIVAEGSKPYWSTTSRNGKRCFVSFSGTDDVAVINFKKRKEIARIPVGDHPQRIRVVDIRRSWIKKKQKERRAER